MENEHTALNGTTTTTTTKKKRGSTPLVVVFTFAITLLLGLALLYAGPSIRLRSSLASGSGGTTRGGAITAASLMMTADDDHFCTVSVGSYADYVSSQDYCFACGHGTSIGYCWNNGDCPPKCDDARGVGLIGDGDCGDPCKDLQVIGLSQKLEAASEQNADIGSSYY